MLPVALADTAHPIDRGVDANRERERAGRVLADLQGRRFDGERYDFEVDVERVAALGPDGALRDVLLDGVVVYRTAAFETARERARSESDDD